MLFALKDSSVTLYLDPTELATLRERLHQLRLEHGLTLEQLAIQSAVPLTTISRLERGATSNPTFKALNGLANALGVSIDYLTGRTDERK